jgi:hypothetical protein
MTVFGVSGVPVSRPQSEGTSAAVGYSRSGEVSGEVKLQVCLDNNENKPYLE